MECTTFSSSSPLLPPPQTLCGRISGTSLTHRSCPAATLISFRSCSEVTGASTQFSSGPPGKVAVKKAVHVSEESVGSSPISEALTSS